MNLANIGVGGVLAGTLASLALHAGAGGSLYYWFLRREPPPIVAELDLSMAPVMTAPSLGAPVSRPRAAPAWIAPKKGPTPAPVVPQKPETKPEVVKDDASNAAPCEGAGCKETGPGGTADGVATGDAGYRPVENTFRKPRWLKNFITSRDYPSVARQQGKDGRVVLVVLLDAAGHVNDARVVEGSYDVLNEVALRKIREAVFSPAYDASGRAVPCRVTLPIRFELR